MGTAGSWPHLLEELSIGSNHAYPPAPTSLTYVILLSLQEWHAQQDKIKAEPLEITYSYWDGQVSV